MTLWIAHVDDEKSVIHLERYTGDETSFPFPVAEIVSDVIEHDSAGIVLAYNRISDSTYITTPELRLTSELAATAEACNCAVLDYLFFAGSECVSFKEMGLL